MLVAIKWDWMQRRVNESCGFVSRRIVSRILFVHSILYGTSMSVRFEKFTRVINPWDVSIVKRTFDQK